MVINDTPEKLKPQTGFSATATFNNSFGERKLTRLELFSNDKNIVLDEKECASLMEAITLKGWVLSSFENRRDYTPYKRVAGSLDGGKIAHMSMYDEDNGKLEILEIESK